MNKSLNIFLFCLLCFILNSCAANIWQYKTKNHPKNSIGILYSNVEFMEFPVTYNLYVVELDGIDCWDAWRDKSNFDECHLLPGDHKIKVFSRLFTEPTGDISFYVTAGHEYEVRTIKTTMYGDYEIFVYDLTKGKRITK